jgi:hypothetical protein
MRTRFIVVALIVTGGVLSGCAFGDRQADMAYPPAPEESSMAAAAAPASTPRGAIYVGAFEDIRLDKTIVGNVRNGFGMKTAKVIPQRDVTVWVRDALVYELEAAGYTVVDGAAAPTGTAVLSGDILRAYCDVYFTYDGLVILRIEARNNGRALLNQSYSGTGSTGLNWAATGDSFSESLALALQAALQEFLADLGNLEI